MHYPYAVSAEKRPEPVVGNRGSLAPDMRMPELFDLK